jgi:hypothetical protein
MTGTYDGDEYTIEAFGSGDEDGWYVQHRGHERHEVRLPAWCDCGDHSWKGMTQREPFRVCRHLKALRKILDEHGEKR